MDKVDISKGNSSIKAMTLSQAGYQTLIDAFLVSKDAKDADKIDLNERVKRIIKSRVEEFNIWLNHSEKELRKRYEMEKIYLKSQVNSLKLYARWAKPYLKAAQELESKGSKSAALVKTFDTLLLELSLFGKKAIDIKNSALAGDLPREFSEEKYVRNLSKRKYYLCALVNFTFREIPRKISQQGNYVFGGRAEVTFQAFALNEDELEKLHKELDKSDLNDVLGLIEGSTTESLEQIEEEIEFFLKEQERDEQKKAGSENQSNPFLALVGGYNKKEESPKKNKGEKEKPVKRETWIEKEHIRPLAVKEAIKTAFEIFDNYKKGHGMESYT